MLHHWSIKLRIVGVSVIVIVVMSSIAVIGLVTGRSVQANFDAYVSSAGISGFAADWRGDITQLQRLGRNYLDSGLATDLDAQRAQKAAVDKRLAAAPPRTAAEQQMIDQIEKSLADYGTDFENAVKLTGQLNDIKKTVITDLGIDLRTHLTDGNNIAIKAGNLAASSRIGILLQDFLLARIRVQRYLDTGVPADSASSIKAVTDFKAELDKLIADAPADIAAALTKAQAEAPLYLQGINDVTRLHDAVEDIRTKTLTARENATFGLLGQLAARTADSMEAGELAARALSANSTELGIVTAAVAIIVSLLIGWRVGGGIANPVQRLNKTMMRVVEGETDLEIEGLAWQDEVGAMARAVAIFRDNAAEKRQLEAEKIKKQQADKRRQEEIDQLVGLFGKSMSCLFKTTSDASAHMSATSSALEASAIASTGQAEQVMVEAEQSNSGAQTVAAASQELSSSIEEISRQVTHSSQIAGAAIQQVSDAGTICNELRVAADSIGNVVKLIYGIASQTNLLALNATIEAARAGAAGKGFAVVASEVKALASQTSLATNEITEQVAAIQSATKGAVAALDAIGGTIHEINKITVGITAAVEEQGAATQEIARSIAQVSTNTANVTARMSAVRQATDSSSVKALEVKEKAKELAQESTILSGEVKDFIEALGELGDAKSFRTYTVDLAAVVKLGAGTIDRRVVSLSSGAVRLDGPIDAPLGTRVAFTIAGVAGELSGRIVQSDSNGALIQLPLNHAHLAAMQDLIGGLVAEAA